jgi:hypothetical protein
VDAFTDAPHSIVVLDGERSCSFSFQAMLDYHGGGSPAGVAHAFKLMQFAFPLLSADGVQRREVVVRTAFGGPGARDALELVLRAVTDGRLELDPSLARPERGVALERFVFVLGYRDVVVTVQARQGFVPDELISLARIDSRNAAQEARFAAIKLEAASLVMSHRADEVYELVEAQTG